MLPGVRSDVSEDALGAGAPAASVFLGAGWFFGAILLVRHFLTLFRLVALHAVGEGVPETPVALRLTVDRGFILAEHPVEIGDDVVDALDAHREPHEPGRDTHR